MADEKPSGDNSSNSSNKSDPLLGDAGSILALGAIAAAASTPTPAQSAPSGESSKNGSDTGVPDPRDQDNWNTQNNERTPATAENVAASTTQGTSTLGTEETNVEATPPPLPTPPMAAQQVENKPMDPAVNMPLPLHPDVKNYGYLTSNIIKQWAEFTNLQPGDMKLHHLERIKLFLCDAKDIRDKMIERRNALEHKADDREGQRMEKNYKDDEALKKEAGQTLSELDSLHKLRMEIEGLIFSCHTYLVNVSKNLGVTPPDESVNALKPPAESTTPTATANVAQAPALNSSTISMAAMGPLSNLMGTHGFAQNTPPAPQPAAPAQPAAAQTPGAAPAAANTPGGATQTPPAAGTAPAGATPPAAATLPRVTVVTKTAAFGLLVMSATLIGLGYYFGAPSMAASAANGFGSATSKLMGSKALPWLAGTGAGVLLTAVLYKSIVGIASALYRGAKRAINFFIGRRNPPSTPAI